MKEEVKGKGLKEEDMNNRVNWERSPTAATSNSKIEEEVLS